METCLLQSSKAKADPGRRVLPGSSRGPETWFSPAFSNHSPDRSATSKSAPLAEPSCSPLDQPADLSQALRVCGSRAWQGGSTMGAAGQYCQQNPTASEPHWRCQVSLLSRSSHEASSVATCLIKITDATVARVLVSHCLIGHSFIGLRQVGTSSNNHSPA